jgi:cysteinyl-tRNA synthetase
LRDYDFNADNCNIGEIDWLDKYAVNFKNAMDDDFNTSLAISVLFEIVTEINREKNSKLAKLLYTLANTIGLLNSNPQQFLQSGVGLSVQFIEEMIVKRNQARLDRDFALSDKIRDELLSNNIVLEDSKNGTIWRKL